MNEKHRAAIYRIRPWEKATGPKTPEGKARSSRNSWKHGRYTANAIRDRRRYKAKTRWAKAALKLMNARHDQEYRPRVGGSALRREGEATESIIKALRQLAKWADPDPQWAKMLEELNLDSNTKSPDQQEDLQ